MVYGKKEPQLIGRVMSTNFSGQLMAFLNGVLLALIVVFYVQSQFISTEIQYIVESVATATMSPEQKALALLHEANIIVAFGMRNAESEKVVKIQRMPLRSFDEAVLLPGLACGDAVAILYRLLNEAGIDSRIGQLRCDHLWGCHIIIEAKIADRWVVLDPLYGTGFRNEQGQLATFNEISANWSYFSQQVPPNYLQDIDYDGVRYTNWEKIPIVMPLLRRVLVAVLGDERTSALSLRTYFMAVNRVYMVTCLVALVLLNGAGLVIRRRARRRSG